LSSSIFSLSVGRKLGACDIIIITKSGEVSIRTD
jgi:hypothetical protein